MVRKPTVVTVLCSHLHGRSLPSLPPQRRRGDPNPALQQQCIPSLGSALTQKWAPKSSETEHTCIYLLPIAAITNGHRLMGLIEHNVYFSVL